MNEFYNLVEGKELIVRKNVVSFLEKLLRYLGYDFRHDIFKKIIYNEAGIVTPFEEKFKSYYDAYIYLLSNSKNPITKHLLMRFFYIIFGNEIDEYVLCKLVNIYFVYGDLSGLEIAIKYHIDVYKELKNQSEEDRLIISLMIFNFLLVKHNIPTIKFSQRELKEYKEARDSYLEGNRIQIYDVILKIIKNKEKYQDKDYYQKLKKITLGDIIEVIKKDEETLSKLYKIKSILIFGSFASSDERIDSDIDLLIAFSLDLSYQKKHLYCELLKKHYFEIFNRFIDITEISLYLSDELIKELTYVKKIF